MATIEGLSIQSCFLRLLTESMKSSVVPHDRSRSDGVQLPSATIRDVTIRKSEFSLPFRNRDRQIAAFIESSTLSDLKSSTRSVESFELSRFGFGGRCC